jgi:hypothetical protein
MTTVESSLIQWLYLTTLSSAEIIQHRMDGEYDCERWVGKNLEGFRDISEVIYRQCLEKLKKNTKLSRQPTTRSRICRSTHCITYKSRDPPTSSVDSWTDRYHRNVEKQTFCFSPCYKNDSANRGGWCSSNVVGLYSVRTAIESSPNREAPTRFKVRIIPTGKMDY